MGLKIFSLSFLVKAVVLLAYGSALQLMQLNTLSFCGLTGLAILAFAFSSNFIDESGNHMTGSRFFRLQQMLDNIPINVLTADLEGKINYMNSVSKKTLESIKHLLPIGVDEIEGASYDVFHKIPEKQRELLSNPKNLPHKAIIEVGDEKLDLLVTALYDQEGNYTGPLLTWAVVTEKIKLEEESNRARQIIDNLPFNVLTSKLDGTIDSMNPASRKTLQAVQGLLPIPVDKIVGTSMDVFHKIPSRQKQLLANPKNLPHKAVINRTYATAIRIDGDLSS